VTPLLSDLIAPLQGELGLRVRDRGVLEIEVPLGQRGHRVTVEREGEWLVVCGRIAEVPNVGLQIRDLLAVVLQANHEAELLGFERSEDNWLVARCDLPGVVPVDEIARAVRRVAGVADRWEEVWVGLDAE